MAKNVDLLAVEAILGPLIQDGAHKGRDVVHGDLVDVEVPVVLVRNCGISVRL